MEEIKSEQTSELGVSNNEYSEKPVDLIEMVRAKHSESEHKREHQSDVLFMQIVLCMLLVFIFTVVKLAETSAAQWFADEFKRMSAGQPEEFIKQAVSRAVEYIK